jgi:ABC-2 type transport system permease protein
MKALEIARVSILRTFRDRMGLFFILVLPIILIVVLGMTYGGMGAARIGVTGADEGPLAGDLVAGIKGTDLRLDLRRYDTVEQLRDAVERGFVEFGIAIPADYDEALRTGKTASLEYVAQPESVASAVKTAVDAAIADQAALIRAARFTAAKNGIGFDQALTAARAEQPKVAGVGVTVSSVGDLAVNPSGFAVGAESQLILFMFLTSMTGAVPLIISRQLGISRREFSTPTSAGTIILGEALGRFALALFQGTFIVVASALLFGVDWMDPLATGAIVVAFAMVSAGAAMLIGALASNPRQAGAVVAGRG